MNAFKECQEIENKGVSIILDFLKLKACNNQAFFITDRKLQKSKGDFYMKTSESDGKYIELKAESDDKSGNFFLETWSNKQFGMQNPGWMVTLKSDFLFYYFLNSDTLYIMNFKKLWEWAFDYNNIYKYEEKRQRKREQKNITKGHIVPIKLLCNEMKVNICNPAKEIRAAKCKPHIEQCKEDCISGEIIPIGEQLKLAL